MKKAHGTPRTAPAAAKNDHKKKDAKKGTANALKARPVKPGALPRGREEERRGHALPNDPRTMGPPGADDGVLGSPLGRDESALHGVDDV
jgi:hypothetical protein